MSDTKSNYQTRSKNAKRKTRDQQQINTVEKRKNIAKSKKRKLTNKKTQGEIIEDAVDEIICYKCGYGHDEENLLLCDNCPRGFHMECLDPPLLSTPSSAWWCPICTSIIPVYDDNERKFDLKDIVPGYTEKNFPLEAWKKIVLYLKKEEQLSLRLVNRFFDNLVSHAIFYRLSSKIPFENLIKFRHPWAVKEFLVHYDEKVGISTKKLGDLLQRFSNIELLDIRGENFTTQGLEIVGKYLLNIKALHFNFSNRISSLPIGAKFGHQFGNLECIELDYHTIPNRPYLYDLTLVKKFLTELINLKHIQFQLIDTKSCKSLWSCVAQCLTLESLGIQFRGDWDFIDFNSIKHIKHLNIEALHTEVQQDFAIKELDNLQSVILKLGYKINNFEISNCKNLYKIDISGGRLFWTNVSIKQCPKLKELYLYGVKNLSNDRERPKTTQREFQK